MKKIVILAAAALLASSVAFADQSTDATKTDVMQAMPQGSQQVADAGQAAAPAADASKDATATQDAPKKKKHHGKKHRKHKKAAAAAAVAK